jgi:hypothetical protein
MRKRTYCTISGRRLDLSGLGNAEREVLVAVCAQYERAPEWSAFGRWWLRTMTEAGLSESSPAFRVCQDLEARIGIAQGMLASPDYRDMMADLIEDRYGSRSHFCEEAAVDPDQLARALAGQSQLPIQSLQAILDALHATLVIRTDEGSLKHVASAWAARDLANAIR